MEFKQVMDVEASTLVRDGVVVLRVMDQRTTDLFRQAFEHTRLAFPEFLGTEEARALPEVMGGFGAYGNPSSFHNPYIRTLRLVTAETVVGFFRRVAGLVDLDPPPEAGGAWHLEMLFDRMCRRPNGTSTSAEAPHRDLNPQTVETCGDGVFKPRSHDYCFGGWINLDPAGCDQTFTCVKGTHRDPILMHKTAGSESGFTTQEQLTGDVSHVRVPPGHMVVFFQRILHIVHSRKSKYDSYRQFRCWRLLWSGQVDPAPLNGWDEWHRVINDMAVPRLPSRQVPPMYSQMHASTFLFKPGKRPDQPNMNDPVEWTARKVHPLFTEDRICRGRVHFGRPYRIARRFFPSLYDTGLLHTYDPYHPTEADLTRPMTRWTLPQDTTIHGVHEILSLQLLHRPAHVVLL